MSALAILGIGALESGWGTSNIAKKTNNIWGYGATNVNPEATPIDTVRCHKVLLNLRLNL